jgi:hypothetical protein
LVAEALSSLLLLLPPLPPLPLVLVGSLESRVLVPPAMVVVNCEASVGRLASTETPETAAEAADATYVVDEKPQVNRISSMSTMCQNNPDQVGI